MNKQLLSATEENAILITVEFVHYGTQTIGNPVETSTCDLDLIVNRDITLHQLVEAVGIGLEKRLTAYGMDTDNLQPNHINWRNRRPDDAATPPPPPEETPTAAPEGFFATCLAVYRQCYPLYETPTNTQGVQTPRVGIGCLHLGRWNQGDFLSEAHENQIWVDRDSHGDKTLASLGFLQSSRLVFDATGHHSGGALFQPENISPGRRDSLPLYTISERPLLSLDTTPVSIIPPTDPPRQAQQSLMAALLAPLLMAISMATMRLMSNTGGSAATMALLVAMPLVTVFSMVIQRREAKKAHGKALATWRTQYEGYIQKTITNIQEKQAQDVETLQKLHPVKSGTPDAPGLVQLAAQVHSDIFTRGQSHPQFLTVRLGLSAPHSHLVPSVFAIQGEKRDMVFTSEVYKNIDNRKQAPFSILLPKDGKPQSGDGYLTDLPLHLAQRYAFLPHAPVLLNLKTCMTLGLLLPRHTWQPFLSNLLLELCFYHAPDDLQCVLFAPPCAHPQQRHDGIALYHHLPHFRELLGNISPFAFDEAGANLVFNKLTELLKERESAEADAKFPHILVILQDEYDLKRHPLSQYLPTSPQDTRAMELGISFVFCKEYSEQLPAYCGNIIRHVEGESTWSLLPHEQVILREFSFQSGELQRQGQYAFLPDALPPAPQDLDGARERDAFFRAYKILSALHSQRIAQLGNVPSRVDFVDLYPELSDSTAQTLAGNVTTLLEKTWAPANRLAVTRSLAVPIGKKSDDANSLVFLNLHESADGAHMIGAGTTGSGKTTTIHTLLLGLCAQFTPEQVNLLLVDMKGGGFAARLAGLPHVVGIISDISGEETGTGTAYMLQRFLQTMQCEIKRRKLLFRRMGVENLDDYIRARSSKEALRAHQANLKITDPHRLAQMDALLAPAYALPHLFLVIDEFAELMRFSSENAGVDFKTELSTLARVGRSLGFHNILVSQTIQASISNDIRENVGCALCLKVATRETSKEMLGTDLAASPLMPGNGRAYLRVGTGARFEYFQSAFPKAYADRTVEQPVSITLAELSGNYTSFYNSYQDNPITKANIAQASQGQTQDQVLIDCIQAYASAHQFQAPHPIFHQPLPTACYYDPTAQTTELEVI